MKIMVAMRPARISVALSALGRRGLTKSVVTSVAAELKVRAFFEAAAQRYGPPRALDTASFGPLELDPRAPLYSRLLLTPKPGWRDADLLAPFAALGIPIALDTDVNAAALAGSVWGAGRSPDGAPLDALVYTTVGPAIVARLGCELGDASPDHPIWGIEADYLGQLCAQLTLMLSPQRTVLGGGVSCSTHGCIHRSACARSAGWAAISHAANLKTASMISSLRRDRIQASSHWINGVLPQRIAYSATALSPSAPHNFRQLDTLCSHGKRRAIGTMRRAGKYFTPRLRRSLYCSAQLMIVRWR